MNTESVDPTWHASSRHGVVAAGGVGAVDAGISILEAGGNAADAAAATIFALNVTDHIQCSIGGSRTIGPKSCYPNGARIILIWCVMITTATTAPC